MANPLYGQNKADDAIDNQIGSFAGGNLRIREYFEVVEISSTVDDNDVAATLTKKLPVGCIILDATLVQLGLATSDHGNFALEVHNAAIANDAASGGTEIVGADVASNVSIPDADLDCSSNANANVAVNMGSLGAVDRTTAVTFFHLCAKEDCSSMTGTPKVGVYLKWFGPPAVDV